MGLRPIGTSVPYGQATYSHMDVPMAHIRELMAHTQWAVCWAMPTQAT